MTTIQNDLLDIYNNLVIFSKATLQEEIQRPIVVKFDKEFNSVVFEQQGNSVRLSLPIYYSLGLDSIKETYLLPKDYDSLMSNLSRLIASGKLLEDRVCLSPENYGFDIYYVDMKQFWKGPEIIGRIRFVSGNSWLFKFITKRKYEI